MAELISNFLFISIVTIYILLPVGCQDLPLEVAASIQALLNEETILRTKIQNELRDLNSELTSLQAMRQNVTCGCPWHQNPVAFSATLTRDITTLGTRQQVTFDKVITNVGNGYDARHGQFRAPSNGTYEFSVAMLMAPGYWAGLEIVKNSNPIARVRSGDSQDYSMSATVVTTELKTGDDVWVDHISESDSNRIYGQSYSSFSGHLIQP